VLVKTRGALIENCAFERIDCAYGAAVCVAAEGWWHEGVTSENVTIRGNRIVGCTSGIHIAIDAPQPDVPAHKNIIIENNIIDCPGCKCAIRAGNVDGLTLRANHIRSGGQDILIENCLHVHSE